MKKYICEICGYVYDPEIGDPAEGIEAHTPFDDLPHNWLCPPCTLGKEFFSELN